MHRIKYLIIAVLAALPILGWAAVVHAQTFRSGDNITLAADKTINGTLYAAGRTLDIAGTVNGDIFCAGQDITISGEVHGDIICAGQNVTISGQITGDIRLVGQDVKLSAAVSDNVTIGAQTFVQQQNSTIGGDITIGAQNATFNGSIGRDLTGGVNTLVVANSVGRDIDASVQQLKLDGNAQVGGNVNYHSANKISQSGNAQVAGKITQQAPTKSQNRSVRPWAVWPVALYLYLTFVVMALVLVLLVPRVFEHATRAARVHLGKTLLLGFAAGIIVPLLLLGLTVSIVGLPLALLFGLGWVLLLLLSGPFAAYLLGRILLRGQTNAILVMLLGAAVLFLLYLLPIIGLLFWLAGTWFGLGTILLQWHHFGGAQYAVGLRPAAATTTAKRKS